MVRIRQSILPQFLIPFVFALAGILAGCAGGASAIDSDPFPMAPIEQMPSGIQDAPLMVQEAYQFAVANPGILKQLPCYCGCGNMGHTSNYACYVRHTTVDGTITYDLHALGCSICVDITQDAMRLLKEDKTLVEIRAYIDKTYSQYGPSNIPGEQ